MTNAVTTGKDGSLSERVAGFRDALCNWWECGEQRHPLLMITLPVDNPVPVPEAPSLERFWFDAHGYVARTVAGVQNAHHLGVAVPHCMPNLGSAAMCGALGSRMGYVDDRTMWAEPCCRTLEEVLALRWSEEIPNCRVLMDETRGVALRSHERFYVAPFPLEGPGDIVAGVLGTTELLIAMADQRELVGRAMEHTKRLWIEGFQATQRAIALGHNPGYVGWAGIWSPGTTFPMQEDFSYNISPAMFRAYCLPHLRDIAEAMDYAMYHLDGVPALRHLEALLEIESLRVIQWVPGPGHQQLSAWYELIRHIIAHGRAMEVFAEPDEVAPLVAAVGARGLLIRVTDPTREEAERLIEQYGSA